MMATCNDGPGQLLRMVAHAPRARSATARIHGTCAEGAGSSLGTAAGPALGSAAAGRGGWCLMMAHAPGSAAAGQGGGFRQGVGFMRRALQQLVGAEMRGACAGAEAQAPGRSPSVRWPRAAQRSSRLRKGMPCLVQGLHVRGLTAAGTADGGRAVPHRAQAASVEAGSLVGSTSQLGTSHKELCEERHCWGLRLLRYRDDVPWAVRGREH
jgi:hypothetical protein